MRTILEKSIKDEPSTKLLKLRTERGLSQEKLAKSLFLTQRYISMLERGERKPSIDIAESIAAFYGTTIEEIFFNNSSTK